MFLKTGILQSAELSGDRRTASLTSALKEIFLQKGQIHGNFMTFISHLLSPH
jgi:hypothetical protein